MTAEKEQVEVEKQRSRKAAKQEKHKTKSREAEKRARKEQKQKSKRANKQKSREAEKQRTSPPHSSTWPPHGPTRPQHSPNRILISAQSPKISSHLLLFWLCQNWWIGLTMVWQSSYNSYRTNLWLNVIKHDWTTTCFWWKKRKTSSLLPCPWPLDHGRQTARRDRHSVARPLGHPWACSWGRGHSCDIIWYHPCKCACTSSCNCNWNCIPKTILS